MYVSLAQLRAARVMLAWTSDDLARLARMHRHTLRKLECGKATPQRGTLSRIVAALEAGGVEFTGGGVQPKTPKRSFPHPKRARDARAFGLQIRSDKREAEMRRGKETEQSSMPTADAGKDEYEPTPAEAEALRQYFAARTTCGPRIKVAGKDVRPDHPSRGVAQIALMKAIGTRDSDFYSGLLSQLINVGSPGKEPDESGTNFMLAIVKGIEPRDQIEAMLAAQMGAVHLATMTFARRLAHAENIPQQDSAERAFNKLARTFAAQMAALKEHRSKGEQRMIVQHVNVSDGGQAIVGAINAPSEGGGAVQKSGDQPHALGYATGATMPRQFEAEREAVPSASGSGP